MNRDERRELLLSIEENQLLDDLFNHPGMKIFLKQAQEQHDSIDNLNGVSTLEQLHFKQGQLRILKWFLNWQNMVKDTLLTLVEQAERETALAKGRTESLINDND